MIKEKKENVIFFVSSSSSMLGLHISLTDCKFLEVVEDCRECSRQTFAVVHLHRICDQKMKTSRLTKRRRAANTIPSCIAPCRTDFSSKRVRRARKQKNISQHENSSCISSALRRYHHGDFESQKHFWKVGHVEEQYLRLHRHHYLYLEHRVERSSIKLLTLRG